MTDATTALNAPTADAVETVLAEAADRDEPFNLGVLTDEEIYVYAQQVTAEGPYGTWFSNLGEEARQAAALSAVRVLTSRGELDSKVADDGVGDVRLPSQLAVAVVLRRLDAQLSLRVIGSDGETWYVLRHVRDEIFLREAITPQGFHMLSLVRLDDAERDVHLGRYQLPDDAERVQRPDVDVTLTEAQIESASIGVTQQLGFLDQTSYIGNLALTGDDGEIATSMVHVLADGGVIIGEVGRGEVQYRGATRTTLTEVWDAWRGALSARIASGQASGLAAHPDVLTRPVVRDDEPAAGA